MAGDFCTAQNVQSCELKMFAEIDNIFTKTFTEVFLLVNVSNLMKIANVKVDVVNFLSIF